MKTGRITAKLRDAVPVCLMINDEEVMRYKNIEFPDSLKELEMKNYHFSEMNDGKIIFEIHFEEGVLPEVFPEARTRRSRAAKAVPQPAAERETEARPTEIPDKEPALAETEPEENVISETMGLECNVIGPRRKELVGAISEFTGAKSEYQAAPSFAYKIGAYMVDKEGAVTGPRSMALLAMLVEKGFVIPQ